MADMTAYFARLAVMLTWNTDRMNRYYQVLCSSSLKLTRHYHRRYLVAEKQNMISL